MPTEKNLDILVINQVENKNVYQYMNENNLVNANELYLVTDVDEIATETESGFMSPEDKIKLNSIQTGATKTIIDSTLSADSTNPVQNKVINTKFISIQSDIDNKVPLSRTINGKALTTNITLTAADVGALPNTTVIPSIEGLATETYVNNKFASIVDSAPETLDTLKELSDALGNDPNFATTIATQIGGKVDKVSGKGLSSNDYTTNEKNKLAGIAAGAEVNQNAFSNIIIAGTTISAVNKQDSLTLVAGNNITLLTDENNKKITIISKDTIYGAAGASLGLVKSGGDATITDGIISINDNSHNHSISNITGLQDALNNKQSTLTFDNTPTANSTNPVTSSGIKSYAEKVGVAIGGTAGQVLAKKTNTDYDLEWITPAAEITTDTTLTIEGAAADAKAVGDALKNIVTDVFSASITAPSNTKLLWIDTGNGGIMKYYNGSAWVSIASTWG